MRASTRILRNNCSPSGRHMLRRPIMMISARQVSGKKVSHSYPASTLWRCNNELHCSGSQPQGIEENFPNSIRHNFFGRGWIRTYSRANPRCGKDSSTERFRVMSTLSSCGTGTQQQSEWDKENNNGDHNYNNPLSHNSDRLSQIGRADRRGKQQSQSEVEESPSSRVAAPLREEVRRYIQKNCRERNSRAFAPPHLVGLMVDTGNSERLEASIHYAQEIQQTCEEDGLRYTQHLISGVTTVREIEKAIESILVEKHHDNEVTGLLIFYPIFPSGETETEKQRSNDDDNDVNNNPVISHHRRRTSEQQERGPYKDSLRGVYYKSWDDYIRDLVPPHLDVEGLCQSYNARFLHRDPWYVMDNNWNENDVTALHVNTDDDTSDSRGTTKPYEFGASQASTCKDKSRLHETSLDSTTHARPTYIFPCTPAAVVQVLKTFDDLYDTQKSVGRRFEGNTITILNRSDVVGRPLAALLQNDGADRIYSIDDRSILVYEARHLVRSDEDHICNSANNYEGANEATTATNTVKVLYRRHVATVTSTPKHEIHGNSKEDRDNDSSSDNYLNHVQQCVSESNIVICGVPDESFQIPTEWLLPSIEKSPGTSNFHETVSREADRRNRKTVLNVAHVKNVNEEDMWRLEKQKRIRYVPAVGKVTVAMLESNLIRLHQLMRQRRK